MDKPDFITATWTERGQAVAANVRRMFRTGAQFAIGALGQDLAGLDAFDANWVAVLGAFGGGCVVWVLTTLAAPPKD